LIISKEINIVIITSYKIEQLDINNYYIWAIRAKIIFINIKLWHITNLEMKIINKLYKNEQTQIYIYLILIINNDIIIIININNYIIQKL